MVADGWTGERVRGVTEGRRERGQRQVPVQHVEARLLGSELSEESVERFVHQFREDEASCTDDDDPTPEQTEGPFFKSSSPEQTDLRTGAGGGTALNLSGTVVTTACQPVNGAKVEFWQADDAGEYDNSGYRLRGHQFTDTQGRYALQTVVPGFYPGRTRHIHVMVQAPNQAVLTTQLYFPGEARNASDGIYRAECLIGIRDTSAGKDGTFTFVLNG